MSLCGDSTTTSSGTTTTTPSAFSQQVGQMALNAANQIGNQTYPGFTNDQRVADFSQTQEDAFDLITNYAQQPVYSPAYNTALNAVYGAGMAPAQSVSTERLVDENGQLGSIASYINPYIASALAPAIGDVQEAGQVQRNDIGSSAMMSGAFGDARHGIVEGQQYEGELDTIGGMSAQAYADAFNAAMGYRSADANRFLTVDQSNAALQEQQYARQMQAGTTGLTADQQAQESELQGYLAMLAVGDQKQALMQANKDANYEDYLRSMEWPFRQFDAYTSLLSGVPTAQTVQTSGTTEQPDNGIWGMLGAGLGSIPGV